MGSKQAQPRFDSYMQQNAASAPLSKKAAKRLANAQKSIKTPPRRHYGNSSPRDDRRAGAGAPPPGMMSAERKTGAKLVVGIIAVAVVSVVIIAIASINVFSSIDDTRQAQEAISSQSPFDLGPGDSDGNSGESGDSSLFDLLYSDMLGNSFTGHFANTIDTQAITQEERDATYGDISKLGGFESKEALVSFAATQFKKMFTVEGGSIDSEGAIQELYAQAPPYAIKVLTGGSDANINELMRLTLESMGYDNDYMLANLQGVDTQAKTSATYSLSIFETQAINETFEECDLGYEISSGYNIGVDLTMQSAIDTGTFSAGVPQYFSMSSTGFYAIEIGGRWFIWNAVLS